MKSHANEQRLLWLVCGAIGGLCLAYFWPHEQVQASATDREAKFAICTVDVGPGLPDAVFVMDFSTGRLQGGMLNSQSGVFTNFWYANVVEDFKVTGKGAAKFAMIPGSGFLNQNAQQAGGGGTMATGVIYIAELSTGKVGCYQFHYRNQVAAGAPIQLEPVNYFLFRESTQR
jgi:hypothetical protein